ncbi:phosphatase PAP2 family protein [Hymenobacter antarcticus]|uniref:Phosphatase PAP2 family protein n=1 Tax=Hymenobacter antarcticus TaxID=486270 RepID=A0ABP7QWD3_9BACT
MIALLLSLRHALRVHKLLLLSLLLGLVAPWVIFVNVAEDIWESGGFIGDKWILGFLHAHATPGLTKLALALTAAADPLPMSGLTLLLTLGLAVWSTRQKAWFFGLSVGGAMALNLLVKVLFARPRPDLWPSLKPAFYYSFPSGHAMGAAALVAALGFVLWQHRSQWLVWGVGAWFVLGVGWSRVYLGVHYPSDVLAGWTGSVGWVAGLHVLFSPEFQQLRRLWRAGLHRLWPTVVAAPGNAESPA